VHPSSLPSVDPSESPSVSPSSLPSSSPSGSPLCNGQNGQFQLSLTTDNYGFDISWFLVETDNPSIAVASSGLARRLVANDSTLFAHVHQSHQAKSYEYDLGDRALSHQTETYLTPYGDNKTYIINPSNEPQMCLKVGVEYKFTMVDSYGDGLCCDYGNGGFILTLDGVTIKTVTEFGSISTKTFVVPSDVV